MEQQGDKQLDVLPNQLFCGGSGGFPHRRVSPSMLASLTMFN